jgi:hypothetical protein
MDTKDFELLLKKDRNWLSKYGGFISLIIIGALFFGIIWIKVPEYTYITISKSTPAMIKLNKDYFNAAIGDSILISNDNKKQHVLIVDSINTTSDKETFYLNKKSNHIVDGEFRFIVKERSLLESLMSPFIKK